MVYVQFGKHLGEMVLFLLCIIAMMLLAAELVLNSHFSSLGNNVSISAKRVSSLNKKVDFINKSVSRIEAIHQEHILWEDKVSAIALALPEQISLTQLVMDEKSGVYTFSGKARSREDLLELEQSLEQIEWISSVDIPISQLTQKENLTFSITATLEGKQAATTNRDPRLATQ